MKTSELLKIAKDYLAGPGKDDPTIGKHPFVCITIKRASYSLYPKSNELSDIRNNLLEFIQKSLQGHTTVVGWLREKHPEIRESMDSFPKYRHAWIDQMIQLFGEKGD